MSAQQALPSFITRLPRVLIIEDDEEWLVDVRAMLARKKIYVDTMTPLEALDTDIGGKYDVIIVGHGGDPNLEFVKELRKKYTTTELPIIYTSNVDVEIDAIDAGSTAYCNSSVPDLAPILHMVLALGEKEG